MRGGVTVHVNRHCLRIENDLEGYQRLRWAIKMWAWATLMYDTRTRRLLVLEGDQTVGPVGSLVRIGCYVSSDLPRLSVQSIYDQLADALEQRWELGWVNG